MRILHADIDHDGDQRLLFAGQIGNHRDAAVDPHVRSIFTDETSLEGEIGCALGKLLEKRLVPGYVVGMSDVLHPHPIKLALRVADNFTKTLVHEHKPTREIGLCDARGDLRHNRVQAFFTLAQKAVRPRAFGDVGDREQDQVSRGPLAGGVAGHRGA